MADVAWIKRTKKSMAKSLRIAIYPVSLWLCWSRWLTSRLLRSSGYRRDTSELPQLHCSRFVFSLVTSRLCRTYLT